MEHASRANNEYITSDRYGEDQRRAYIYLREHSITVLQNKIFILNDCDIENNRDFLDMVGITDLIFMDLKNQGSVCNCVTDRCFHRTVSSTDSKREFIRNLYSAFLFLKKRLFADPFNKVAFVDNSMYKPYSIAICLKYMMRYTDPEYIAKKTIRDACSKHGLRLTSFVYRLASSIVPDPVCPPPIGLYGVIGYKGVSPMLALFKDDVHANVDDDDVYTNVELGELSDEDPGPEADANEFKEEITTQ